MRATHSGVLILAINLNKNVIRYVFRPGQVSVQVSVQVRSGQVGSGQARSRQVRSGQVKSGKVVSTPCDSNQLLKAMLKHCLNCA